MHAGVLGDTEYSYCESTAGSSTVASVQSQTEESGSTVIGTLPIQTAKKDCL